MRHWTTSSLAGVVLTGRYRPLCAAAYTAPDCAARRAFLRLMDWWFEPGHCRQIALIYALGHAIR